MNIINVDYRWNACLKKRNKTSFIILHHAAATKCTVEDIHKWHLANGWSGFGYAYLVRKDGSVYAGRPMNTVGAHCLGYNEVSIGVCFEGNFDKEEMGEAQKVAGKELLQFINKNYPEAKLKLHRDLYNTSCPGKNFPQLYFKNISKLRSWLRGIFNGR